jgi:chromosome segregation ATPase
MAKVQKTVSEIERAAQALEEEIARLEGLARSARKMPLNTDKNLVRAAAQLNETLAVPERVAQRLQAVAAAMANMQDRQQAALQVLSAFAVELQQRTQLFEQHMADFGALGQAASEVNAQLVASDGDQSALLGAVGRLQEISDAARAVFDAARAADFPDIAREADVLKQRLSSLRKRLALPPPSSSPN